MPTRAIMIDFNSDVTLAQIEAYQQRLKEVADKIPYKRSFRCGMNRRLETDAALDHVAAEGHVPQFVAIWDFDSYNDLTRFVGDSLHLKFASEIAKQVIRHRWVVNN